MHLSAAGAPVVQLSFIIESHAAALFLHLAHDLSLRCGAQTHTLFLQKLEADSDTEQLVSGN